MSACRLVAAGPSYGAEVHCPVPLRDSSCGPAATVARASRGTTAAARWIAVRGAVGSRQADLGKGPDRSATLLIVTFAGAVVPFGYVPKVAGRGRESDRVPVPFNGTVCGLVELLSATLKVPVRV